MLTESNQIEKRHLRKSHTMSCCMRLVRNCAEAQCATDTHATLCACSRPHCVHALRHCVPALPHCVQGYSTLRIVCSTGYVRCSTVCRILSAASQLALCHFLCVCARMPYSYVCMLVIAPLSLHCAQASACLVTLCSLTTQYQAPIAHTRVQILWKIVKCTT